MTHIDETGIESRHELLDLAGIDVAYREFCLVSFFLILYELLVFEQGDGHFCRFGIDDKFAGHSCFPCSVSFDWGALSWRL